LPDAAQKNPDHAIAVLQRRALSPAAENLEVVAESDVLEDQRFAGAERSSDQVQDEIEHLGRLAGGEL
jgi:hypothetical protein